VRLRMRRAAPLLFKVNLSRDTAIALPCRAVDATPSRKEIVALSSSVFNLGFEPRSGGGARIVNAWAIIRARCDALSAQENLLALPSTVAKGNRALES
jgi:hypothetical protein